MVPLRAPAALLFLGGIIYAMFSGNWGIGAIAFGLAAGARPATGGAGPSRTGHPERAIGWVLVL